MDGPQVSITLQAVYLAADILPLLLVPQIALSREERKTRMEVLDECVRFTKVAWEGRDPVAVMDREFGDEISGRKSSERASSAELPRDDGLAELVDMGFPAVSAQVALRNNDGDVQKSVDWLLQEGHSALQEESVSSQSQDEKGGQPTT